MGCTQEQIDTITGIILATRLPQQPKTLLQQILCDVDMDSLGRDDFFIQSMKLRKELSRVSGDISLKEWLKRQLVFLEEHCYFTVSARKLRNKGKQKNIAEIKLLLKS